MTGKSVQLFIFLGIFTSALALSCYTCDSEGSQLCNYDILSFIFPAKDCNDQLGGSSLTKLIPQKCITLTLKATDGRQFVGRGCVPFGGVCKTAAKFLAGFNTLIDNSELDEIECTPCGQNKCNASIPPYVLPIIIAIAILLLITCCYCCCCRNKRSNFIIVPSGRYS